MKTMVPHQALLEGGDPAVGEGLDRAALVADHVVTMGLPCDLVAGDPIAQPDAIDERNRDESLQRSIDGREVDGLLAEFGAELSCGEGTLRGTQRIENANTPPRASERVFAEKLSGGGIHFLAPSVFTSVPTTA